jgi:Arc/MetJ family transcription regulator
LASPIAKAHGARNSAEYEGAFDIDDLLLAEVLKIARIVEEKVATLGPVPTK